MMHIYNGSCHCRRIRFQVMADLAFVSECNCTICAKKGFLHLIVPREQFTLLAGEGELSTYAFNTRVAKHMFCRTCGMHPFYTPRSDPDKIDVNLRCLDDIDIATITPKPFDGQHWEAAMKTRPPAQ